MELRYTPCSSHLRIYRTHYLGLAARCKAGNKTLESFVCYSLLQQFQVEQQAFRQLGSTFGVNSWFVCCLCCLTMGTRNITRRYPSNTVQPVSKDVNISKDVNKSFQRCAAARVQLGHAANVLLATYLCREFCSRCRKIPGIVAS